MICSANLGFSEPYRVNIVSRLCAVMQSSGTTATVAVLVGWELIVASVGDSCAFFDTGSEVLQVSPAVPEL